MNDDLIICRCEEITCREIRSAIWRGAATLTGLKRRTRAGMGLCQGRTCGTLISRILSRELGRPVSSFEPDTSRPPVVPVPIRVLRGDHE